MRVAAIIAGSMAVCTPVSGGEPPACLYSAAARFGHDAGLLAAIGHVESGWDCTATSKANRDGSYDMGCLQINSSWLPLLRRKFGLSKEDLMSPCVNINVGAWILAKNKQQFGDSWRAVGAFNAASESKRISYAWKVNSRLAGSGARSATK